MCELSDKIKAIVSADDALLQSVNETIDAEGNYVSPGFIDTHVHGGAGYEFVDATKEAILKASRMVSARSSILLTK